MPEFFALSADERRDALAVAADASGRPIHLLEKDVWVVWALQALFGSPYGRHLVFKGGTSLSKGYGVISRFSEDVDLTYDIREIAGDLIAEAGSELPASRSQGKRWTDAIRERLARTVSDEFAPMLSNALQTQGLAAKVSPAGDKIFLEYGAIAPGYGYVKPKVMLEFGARSTGEPSELREVVCDAAIHLPMLTFPSAKPMVMIPERTFWEKATAIHVYCHQGTFRGGDRFARHWHDLTRLDVAGYAAKAIANKSVAKDVADHKSAFFVEKDNTGAPIDYHRAIDGGLQLIPTDDALEALTKDYEGMVNDGLLMDEAAPFEKLLESCKAIQDRANSQAK